MANRGTYVFVKNAPRDFLARLDRELRDAKKADRVHFEAAMEPGDPFRAFIVLEPGTRVGAKALVKRFIGSNPSHASGVEVGHSTKSVSPLSLRYT